MGLGTEKQKKRGGGLEGQGGKKEDVGGIEGAG